MKKVLFVFPGEYGNEYRKAKGWNDHYDAESFPFQAPAQVLTQPENDMQVLEAPDFR